jgi:UDP-N-acetylglucosamine transferase subunit ALG13
MIFVTAGTQKPFDRLVKAIDELALEIDLGTIVVQALHSDFKPSKITIVDFISPVDFNKYIDDAQLIISHAGMGTIISALVKSKPIIVMPRLVKYNEHRNEHQLATVEKMEALNYVEVAYDEHQLKTKFLAMWPDKLSVHNTIGNVASNELVNSIQTFIKH